MPVDVAVHGRRTLAVGTRIVDPDRPFLRVPFRRAARPYREPRPCRPGPRPSASVRYQTSGFHGKEIVLSTRGKASQDTSRNLLRCRPTRGCSGWPRRRCRAVSANLVPMHVGLDRVVRAAGQADERMGAGTRAGWDGHCVSSDHRAVFHLDDGELALAVDPAAGRAANGYLGEVR